MSKQTEPIQTKVYLGT